MINYTHTSQYISRNVLKKYIKYNLLANGYNADNTTIYYNYNHGIMTCFINYDFRKYVLEFTTLPNNCSTVYMLNSFDMNIPMHLIKSFFGALKFTNILSEYKLNNEYSKEIFYNLYITKLNDEYFYTQKDNYRNAPKIKEVVEDHFINDYITYFTKVHNNDLTNIIKYKNFPYHILYNIWDNSTTIRKVKELQETLNRKILYIYYSDSHLFDIPEQTIFSFKATRTHNYLDIRILGE